MKRALVDATVATMIYRFNMENIEDLEKLGYQIDVSCNWGEGNPSDGDELAIFRSTLDQKKIGVIQTTCPRNLFSVGKILATYRQMKQLADRGHYDLVHTQTAISSVICRLAFRKAQRNGTKVLYEAHGFHFCRGGPVKAWLLFYPAEKLCSYFTDVLVAINQEDYLLAKTKLRAKRTVYVPGVGIDLEKYAPDKDDVGKENSVRLRQSIGCMPEDRLLLSVGELNRNKNHEVIIRALASLKNPEIHYAIAGKGALQEGLSNLAQRLDVADRIHFLGFRDDVETLYKAADVFVHPSYREGLPVSMMEAMASGLPCIGSRIRGNIDLIDEGEGGYLVCTDDVKGYAEKISLLLEHPDTAARMGIHNRQVVRKFGSEQVRTEMRKIYESLG